METHESLTMEVHKFSHEHPLIFISEGTKGNTSDEEINRVCNGCTLPIFSGSPFYTCEDCDKFSLHKTCSEIPMELEYHHKHVDTNLTLQPKSPYFFHCYSCGNSIKHKFYYRCKRCHFILDITCVSSDHHPEINTIQHRSHKHSLKLLGRPALLLCDACGEEHRGHFYMCNSCRFYIHEDCASFPRIIKRSEHHAHSLALSCIEPIAHVLGDDICVICRKSCYGRFWMYWCGRCLYAAHLKCAMSKIEPFMSILLPRVSGRKSDHSDTHIADGDNLIRLPPANEFVSVVGHLTTSTNYGNIADMKEVNDLLCHQHPLVFVDDKSSNSIIESFLFGPDRNYFSNVPQCDVCFRAVSPPFYCCKICKLFFHQMCSKLPSQIQHPLHPKHPIILHSCDRDKFLGIFTCYICWARSNGICYICPTCEISLDVKCALLPRNIIHESHAQHVLALGDKNCPKGSINCCELLYHRDKPGYTCDTCEFGMHAECALYPSTARDTYDEHKFFKLIYDPSQVNSAEYYCQICEDQIDQRYWFYHSVECDRSFHIKCEPPIDHTSFRITAIPSIGRHPNLNFGVTRNFKIHSCPLMFVQHVDGSSCNYCHGHITPDDGLAFECSECNYIIHLDCCGSYETSDPEIPPPIEKTCTKS